MKQLAFIGAGKMATAIASGLVDKQLLTPDEMVAADPCPTARDGFAEATGITCEADNAAVATTAEAILLAVKPQHAGDVLPPLREALTGKLLISIAAGLPIARLHDWSGCDRIVRVMPNTPSMVHLGASVFACSEAATAADRALAQRLLEAVGIARELPEEDLDAVTGLSGSGPAYVFEFIDALADAGVGQGLPRDVALDLVVQTVAGAAEMVRRRRGTPVELRNAVTSKGGTTAAGLQVLADADFRGLIARTVARAAERSRELGKGQN